LRCSGCRGGLVRWDACYKSGFDNELAGAVFPPEHLISPDLNALLYLEMRAMAFLAGRLGIPSDWTSRAEELKKSINQYLWDEKDGCYGTYDVTIGKVRLHWTDEAGHESDLGRCSFVSCPALLVLYAGAAPEDRARRMIENYVLSPEHFRSPWGIRSLSRSSRYFNNALWGGPGRYDPPDRLCNSNWQGPVWVPLCWFALHGLLRYGYEDAARDLADDVIRLLSRSLDKSGGWSENFHSERGDNLEADNFISWNMLADLMPGYCDRTCKMRIFF